MALDDLVSTVETFKWRAPLSDGRVWPFGIIYVLWAGVLGPGSEYGLLALPAIFVIQKTKYILNAESEQFEPLQYPIENELSAYVNANGIDDERAGQLRSYFGANIQSIDAPDFWPLFIERATAPFFVFQVFCVGLWCLDEYWYYSLFTLMMLVMFECTLVQQTMRNLSEIRRMADYTCPRRMLVYRNRRWIHLSSQELVPGDLISVTRSDDALPCDVLLLRGTAVVDESLLTGESIPLIKEGLDQCDNLSRVLDLQTDTKLHVLSGGTKVLQHTGPGKVATGIKPTDSGCLGFVLRTGFSTSQGKLLRTILFGVKRVTANNKETFAFILFLLVFAIAAASYVWTKGIQDPNRSRYKLMLECTLILTSVIPPELPIELSLAVNSSLLALAKLGIFCTEAFRIPFAGKISICCFDKTGTLTSDKLQIDGVAQLDGKVTAAKNSSAEAIRVMVSCHSLVQTDSGLVGDPLEKATLASIEWSVGKGDVCTPDKAKQPGVKIHRRFHFSSALGRMSVISSSLRTTTMVEYVATVKGAPEVIQKMLKEVPKGYEKTHQELSFNGARVLALAYRELGALESSALREMTRDQVESQLQFCGFLVVSCPIKKDSLQAIRQIRHSSHHVTIITGDAPLTACHIARELNFVSRPCLVLDPDERLWKAHNENNFPLSPRLPPNHDFCVTGDGLEMFEKECGTKALAHVRVFARVQPKQKEMIITRLNAIGMVTSMTGDGTNDMGALKHAHVGVALLSDGPSKPKPVKRRPRPDQLLQRLPPRERTRAALEQMLKDDCAGSVALIQDQGRTSESSSDPEPSELEQDEALEVVKLGDASIAAPFTYKGSSVECLAHILKQGRCTLVTTLQMFKILALNALVLAYSQSVLYLDGIKLSDAQATLQGLLLAACFYLISRSKPQEKLSQKRPLANIFNAYTLLTVILQFAVHLSTLIYLTGLYEGLKPKEFREDSKFEPSLLNSTVYILSIALQISTFAVNYRGHPFMESLFENKPLLYALLVPALVVVALVKNLMPDVSSQLELVEFPPDQANLILATLAADLVAAFIIDRVLGALLARGKPVPLPRLL
ncbi:manganese-transporting ATPase 13A1-like isoform X3 [Varroa jacobsoni]|uniref:manganese-transporting ATPase 13A1-like isoform X3 n=1 Tax=Varroa jacobsoni TaxID=62625 RepID=UPI000BF4C25E|nr:manganese-transporting ATPase 13A1-like isoform X3 [Varroa jacobsoni]